MTDNTTDRFTLRVPLLTEAAGFVLLFGLAVFLRFFYLSADPPDSITGSRGIETDPPQYTVFARNDIHTGEWNPYGDDRYITYEYSLVSGASRIVYGLLGVGTYQANLTAALLSLVSILLFYLIVRRSLGNGTALAALLFVGVNYLGIFFGRRPFLETGMNFLFVLGLFCLAYMERRLIGHFLFGFFLASTILFGKIIGLAFLGVPFFYYLYRFFILRERKIFAQAGMTLAGILLLTGVWYVLVYAPNAEQITGYVGEQAVGLYGIPEGLQSIRHFIWKFLVYGTYAEFFERMPAISVATLTAILILGSQLISRRSETESRPRVNAIFIAIAAWLVCTYLAQMPLTYQPVRYLTTLIFPLSCMAAALMAYIYNLKTSCNPLNRSVGFTVLLFVVLMVFIYQAVQLAVASKGEQFYFTSNILYIVLIAAPLTAVYHILARIRKNSEMHLPAAARYTIIGFFILWSLVLQGSYYAAWAKTPLFTVRDASRDLGQVLSANAIISGPFGPALALDNELGCVVHIFGTSRPDPDLFRKYPVTHLAVERSNETVARELYPYIMERAKAVRHYYLSCCKTTIYRIAYVTGNRLAATYVPSEYELAAAYYTMNKPDSGDYYLDRFVRRYPNNCTGLSQKAFTAFRNKDYDTAIHYFRKASEISPTDFYLHYLLGRAYIDKAQATGDDTLRLLGEAEMELSAKYNLGYQHFDDLDGKGPVEDSVHGNVDGKE